MLVVRVELWPYGLETAKELLAEATIENLGNNEAGYSYRAQLRERGDAELGISERDQAVRISGYDRRQSVWNLILRMLAAAWRDHEVKSLQDSYPAQRWAEDNAKDDCSGGAEPSNPVATSATAAQHMVQATLSMAASAGLIHGKKNKRLSVRVSDQLLDAAAAQSGLHGSELIEYALARVALEDDFARRLFAHQGTIDPDIDLDF